MQKCPNQDLIIYNLLHSDKMSLFVIVPLHGSYLPLEAI